MANLYNFGETLRVLTDKISQDQKNLDFLMAQKSEMVDKVDQLAVNITNLISQIRDTKKAMEILQRAMAGE
jgi:peptidoglycan hydrolase CwlO-like protein